MFFCRGPFWRRFFREFFREVILPSSAPAAVMVTDLDGGGLGLLGGIFQSKHFVFSAPENEQLVHLRQGKSSEPNSKSLPDGNKIIFLV